MINEGPCDLHIPHKDWAQDVREQENYNELERWSRVLKTCFTGSCACYMSVSQISASIPDGTGTVTALTPVAPFIHTCGTLTAPYNLFTVVEADWEKNAGGTRYLAFITNLPGFPNPQSLVPGLAPPNPPINNQPQQVSAFGAQNTLPTPIAVWQNSGAGALNVTVTVMSYQLCGCNCFPPP